MTTCKLNSLLCSAINSNKVKEKQNYMEGVRIFFLSRIFKGTSFKLRFTPQAFDCLASFAYKIKTLKIKD